MYGKESFELDTTAIGNAIDLINSGKTERVQIAHDVVVYKAPAVDLTKYYIRIAIQEEKETNNV